MASSPKPLPQRAADTSPEAPWPVRLLSLKMGEYVDKMSVVWVEGQVVQLNHRPGTKTAYLTLRDPDVDMSLSVAISVNALEAMARPVGPGERVVVQIKPAFWPQRGTLMMDSLDLVDLMFFLQREFQFDARLEELRDVKSLDALVDFIVDHLAPARAAVG